MCAHHGSDDIACIHSFRVCIASGSCVHLIPAFRVYTALVSYLNTGCSHHLERGESVSRVQQWVFGKHFIRAPIKLPTSNGLLTSFVGATSKVLTPVLEDCINA